MRGHHDIAPDQRLPRAAALAGGLLLALGSACASSRALRVPELEVSATPFAGTALSGPHPSQTAPSPGAPGTPGGPAAEAALPMAVRCRGLWLERVPSAPSTLEAETSLVVAPGTTEPIRPRALSARGVGLLRGDAVGALLERIERGELERSAPAFEEAFALPPGQAYAVRAAVRDPPRNGAAGGDPPRAGAAGGASASPVLSIAVDRRTAVLEARVLVGLGDAGASAREDLALREPLSASGGALALVFPREDPAGEAAALLIVLDLVDELPPASRDEAWSETARTASERRRALSRAEEEEREIERTLASLERPRERRAALVLLASDCGAPLLLDSALVANEADLEALAGAARAGVSDLRHDRDTTGWGLERAAWLHLAAGAAAGQLAPELSGVLVRQGGEAVRFPGAIEDLLRGATSRAELAVRLWNENRILLEDASPASRVRAFDWLALRGLAPAGFDPLAPLAERRAALEALAASEAAQTASPAAPGEAPE